MPGYQPSHHYERFLEANDRVRKKWGISPTASKFSVETCRIVRTQRWMTFWRGFSIIKLKIYIIWYRMLTYLLTYLLTPWSRVLLEKPTGSATSQEIPRFFRTRMFITVLTSARHMCLSWANTIQSPTTSSHFLKIHLNIILPSIWYNIVKTNLFLPYFNIVTWPNIIRKLK